MADPLLSTLPPHQNPGHMFTAGSEVSLPHQCHRRWPSLPAALWNSPVTVSSHGAPRFVSCPAVPGRVLATAQKAKKRVRGACCQGIRADVKIVGVRKFQGPHVTQEDG